MVVVVSEVYRCCALDDLFGHFAPDEMHLVVALLAPLNQTVICCEICCEEEHGADRFPHGVVTLSRTLTSSVNAPSSR